MGRCILALDPGSDKCGYALVEFNLTVRHKGIAYLGELHRVVKTLVEEHPEVIVIGCGTASRVVRDLLMDLDLGVEIRFGEEKNTTFEARSRYFRDHPPTGFWRLVPLSMQMPAVPIDDYAAILIAERYLVHTHLSTELESG
jgi:RNase H-fold protein (predicted Holliday junction resolvase)